MNKQHVKQWLLIENTGKTALCLIVPKSVQRCSYLAATLPVFVIFLCSPHFRASTFGQWVDWGVGSTMLFSQTATVVLSLSHFRQTWQTVFRMRFKSSTQTIRTLFYSLNVWCTNLSVFVGSCSDSHADISELLQKEEKRKIRQQLVTNFHLSAKTDSAEQVEVSCAAAETLNLSRDKVW